MIRKLNTQKNNKKLLLVVGLVVIVGFVMLYYLNIRNQRESFNDYMETDEVKNLIKNKNNFVLVFHKMEGCGHCVAFKPIWDDFNTKSKKLFKGKKTVKCVTVDPSNELSADVEGFPTIRYYKSVDNYVNFEKGRTLDNLTKFVKENM